MDLGAYCREIEAHLCRRNGGHLVRVVGPAFRRVSGWAEAGVPLKVVLAGIDRKLARTRADRPGRRPLRIEFCEADVLEAFDEWRRAVGVSAAAPAAPAAVAATAQTVGRMDGDRRARARLSLPKHLDRVLERVTGRLTNREDVPEVRAALERLIVDIEGLRTTARDARGPLRESLIGQLEELDTRLLATIREVDDPRCADVEGEARGELAPFKSRLSGASYTRSLAASVDRLLRERFHIPGVRYTG